MPGTRRDAAAPTDQEEHSGPSGREYRVDELARAAGTTVRNVRAYQDRGLLPAPRRQGRVGLYSDAHLARLRLVAQLLERGYTLANIGELLLAWETGQDMGDLLGLEAALAAPWSDEVATIMSAQELGEVFGGAPDAEGIDRALEMGLLEARGDAFLVRRPRVLRAGAELVAAGVPLPAVLRLGEELREHIDRVAAGFVELVATHVFAPVGDPIPAADVPRLAEIVRRLRPLAGDAVDAELAEAMERRVSAQLRERLGRLPGAKGKAS